MSKKNGTDWNKNNGVGSTLLENWVEERAVGDRIIQERSNSKYLNKHGHQDILVNLNKNEKVQMISNTHESHSLAQITQLNKTKVGKLRSLLETEMIKRVIEELREAPIERSAKGWESTNHGDYAHKDIYPPVQDLWDLPPSQEELSKFKEPITYWSDQGKQGNVICSAKPNELKQAIRFGKHSTFSTPIKELMKDSTAAIV